MTSLQKPAFATSFKLSFFYFFYFGAVGIYTVFLPKLLSSLGFSAFEIGFVFSTAPIVRFLSPFLFLKYIKLNKTSFLISLLGVFVLSLLVAFFLREFAALSITLGLMGAFWSISLAFVETLSLKLPHYGKIRLFGSFGFIFITLGLSNFELSSLSFSYSYIGFVSLTSLTGLLLLKNIGVTKQNVLEKFSFLSNARFWLMILLSQVSFGGFYSFFTLYEQDMGFSQENIGYLWTVGVIAEILMFAFGVRLIQKIRLTNLISLSLLLTSIRWFVLDFFSSSLFVSFVSQGLHAFSFALFHWACISYVNHLYPNQKALAQQFYIGIGYGLGAFLGSILAGAVYGQNLFFWMGVICLIAFIIFFKSKKY